MEQHNLEALRDRIERLEKRLRLFYLAGGLAAVLLVMLAGTTLQTGNAQSNSSANILRARGLVIVDEQGRERILLGAPIPPAANRVRSDQARVKEIWAKRFPKEYRKWYQEYRHDMNGLLVLDEKGFDRVAIGDRVPDPNIGKRIGPQTGMIINDEQGFERSGYGLIKVNDLYRVVLGLDSAKGQEGLTLALLDEGGVGLSMQDEDRTLYLGSEPPRSSMTRLAEPFHGLLLRKGAEVTYQLNVSAKK